MTKSELVVTIASKQTNLPVNDVDLAVKTIMDLISKTLSDGHRVEIRGFGSFSLRHRAPRVGRNPKTGESVQLGSKHVPYFKPGKELRDLVNNGDSW